MVLVKRVRVGVTAAPTALEVLAADETRVDIDVREGDRAELLKICGLSAIIRPRLVGAVPKSSSFLLASQDQ